MRIWHVNISEKNPSPLSSGIYESIVVLAESFEECESKVRIYFKELKYNPEDTFIGKIEFIEEVDIQ